MKYIKFDDNGKNAFEAPYKIVKNCQIIFGYNKKGNETMLLEDGWLKYEGACPLGWLELADGVIKENIPEEPAPVENTRFTKLQIRRTLRKAGLEDQLNQLLDSSELARNEWNDCQIIDLNDEAIQTGLANGLIPSGWVDIIKEG